MTAIGRGQLHRRVSEGQTTTGGGGQKELGVVSTEARATADEIERANVTGLTPVVFIHGLWLLPSSWDRWAALFEEAGYVALAPRWPDDPDAIAAAGANPKVLARQ